jgi:hypothetical protein
MNLIIDRPAGAGVYLIRGEVRFVPKPVFQNLDFQHF